MIQQQQVYPHFAAQTMSPTTNSSSSVLHEDSSSTPSPPPTMAVAPTSAAVCVIKETESVRNLSLNGHSERRRSISPSSAHAIQQSIKRESVTSSPPLSLTRSETLSPQSVTTQFNKCGIRITKRSNSADDESYDAEEQIIKHAEEYEQRRFDSDPEERDNDRLYEYSRGSYTHDNDNDNDDEDAPLDLSTGRRRHHSYSDTESGDSAGTNDENADVVGKAAYKKSLMKRYCKYQPN